MKSLSQTERNNLDTFVETYYDKLLQYARHYEQDEEKAQDLLQMTLELLYSGIQSIDWSESPLAYFQHLLRDSRSRLKQNRQIQFEEGVDVEQRNGEPTNRSIREPLELTDSETGDPIDRTSVEAFDLGFLDEDKRWAVYQEVKQGFSERRQWILDQVEKGTSLKTIHARYIKHWESRVEWISFRVEVSRLIGWVREKIEARLQDAA